MPSDTVDLPQPDSPTMPIASPGITVQEKSITAGISPRRGEEGDRQVLDFEDRLAGGPDRFVHGRNLLSLSSTARAARRPNRLRPSTKRHQRNRRRQGRMDEGAQQPAGILDRRAPVRALRRQAEAEIAERAEQDRRVADAQAGIDDQRPARIGQDLPQHDVPWALTARLRRRHIVARLDVHGQAAHDPEHAGARREHHGDEDVQLVGVDRDDAQRIGVEHQAGIDPAADDQGQDKLHGQHLRPVPEPRREKHREEDDREQEEQPRQPVGDRRVHDAGRHQQVEQEDDGEGEHQIGEERQHRVHPAAIIAGRQTERGADHEAKAVAAGAMISTIWLP